ncbi:MAG: SAM-dependent chlorinase/fluorinase [Acidobacteria bacterium]|nr:SAM-dependent chlorinase/fluorinase [Acidobacteriota bacterium]
MGRPVIAFLTDFGTQDHYVAAMKGVVLGICPDVTLVDVSHDISPQNVRAGALELAAVYRFFPAGTIFLAVIDPGVGTDRRALAAEAAGYLFVTPDNGTLTEVLRESPPQRVVDVTAGRYARSTISRTFEGRDRFAPAAAWLAAGTALAELGNEVTTWQTLAPLEPTLDQDRIVGEVVRVDHFGNMITNVHRTALERFAGGAGVSIAAGEHVIDHIVMAYADVAQGVVCALFGSSDHLEVAVNGGSATRRLGLGCGAPITISRT